MHSITVSDSSLKDQAIIIAEKAIMKAYLARRAITMKGIEGAMEKRVEKSEFCEAHTWV